MLILDVSSKRLPSGGQIVLTTWPSDAGQLPGGFDVDTWEEAQTFYVAAPGGCLRAAFDEAYRSARVEARKHGGVEFLIPPDHEPIRFPDLEANGLRAPEVIVLDGGPGYRSPVKLSGEELLELGRLVWLEQLERLRALVTEAIETGKNYAEFDAEVCGIFPGGFGANQGEGARS